MRIKITNSKNSKHYSIIQDIVKNGKRTTKIFEKLGNQEQVEKRFGKTDTINKIKEYIDELNNENKEELLKREYNPNKRIAPGIKRQFNVGYLFLQKLYNQLKINEICKSIQDKYSEYDLSTTQSVENIISKLTISLSAELEKITNQYNQLKVM